MGFKKGGIKSSHHYADKESADYGIMVDMEFICRYVGCEEF